MAYSLLTWSALLGWFIFAAFGAETTEKPYATANPDAIAGILSLIGEDYELPENVYDWNITEIIYLVEQASPGLLCGIEQNFFAIFPEDLLVELPTWVKWCQDFICLIEEDTLAIQYNVTYDDFNLTCNNTDFNLTASCSDPLVNTDRYSTFPGGCGISCGSAGLLHGFSNSTLYQMRVLKWVTGVISLTFLGIWIVNQRIEAKQDKSRQTCCDKNMLHQSTTMVTFFYSATITLYLLPDVIGANLVLCADNPSDRIIVLGNPKFGWAPCTVFGVIFYICVMGLSFYLAAFAISLWQAFYKPLTQAWETNCSINLRFLDILFLSEEAREAKASSPVGETDTRKKTFSAVGSNEMYHRRNQMKQTKCGQTLCGQYCISCMFSKVLKWHIVLWIIMLGFVIGSLVNNVYDAFHPLAICYPGARGNKRLVYEYSILPLFAATCVMATFMPCAGMLLFQTAKSSSSHGQRKRMTQLGRRLAIFFFGVLFCWLCIFAFAGHIAVSTEKIEEATKRRITCALGHGKDCWNIGFHINQGLLILFLLSTCVACFCSMVLSFHSRTIERWMTWCPFLRTLRCCSVLKRWTEEVNASRTEKSGDKSGEKSAQSNEKSIDKSRDTEKSKSGNHTSPANTSSGNTARTNTGEGNLLAVDAHARNTSGIELTTSETSPR